MLFFNATKIDIYYIYLFKYNSNPVFSGFIILLVLCCERIIFILSSAVVAAFISM